MKKPYSALVKIHETKGGEVKTHRELWDLENLDDLKRITKKFTDDGFVVELEGIAKSLPENKFPNEDSADFELVE